MAGIFFPPHLLKVLRGAVKMSHFLVSGKSTETIRLVTLPPIWQIQASIWATSTTDYNLPVPVPVVLSAGSYELNTGKNSLKLDS